MVGCVAWVMAILLNCFEIIVKEGCELSKGKENLRFIVKEIKETMNSKPFRFVVLCKEGWLPSR
jgi:hypothetical protein